MERLNKQAIFGFLLIVSALFSYLIVVPSYFPYFGVSVSLAILSTVAFIFQGKKSVYSFILYLFTLLYSFFIVFRSNAFLTLLNILAVFWFGSLMALYEEKNSFIGFFNFLLSPLTLLLGSLKTTSIYTFDFDRFKTMREGSKKQNFVGLATSIIFSITLLVIIIPLLASTNPLFGRLAVDVLNALNIKHLVNKVFSLNTLFLVRLLVFLVFIFFLPRFFSYVHMYEKGFKNILNIGTSISFLIPKVALALVLIIFFITQTQLYFADSETLESLGYTHSQHAREVFTQLSIVAFIIFGLVYNDASKKRWSQILTYTLIVEGLFLSLIAFKSDFDYSSVWGFTHKRLYGFSVVFWTLGAFLFFLYKYVKNISNTHFVKVIILFSGIVLLGINVANFDYIIYHLRKTILPTGLDHFYLSQLSSDAQSYGDQFLTSTENMKKLNTTSDEFELLRSPAFHLMQKIERLQKNYKHIDVRIFNISDYMQYQKIKRINTKDYYQLLMGPFEVVEEQSERVFREAPPLELYASPEATPAR